MYMRMYMSSSFAAEGHLACRAAIAPPLPRVVKYVTEPKGKAALIHLLGECGEVVPEAPYSLERLIDRYDDFKRWSTTQRSELLLRLHARGVRAPLRRLRTHGLLLGRLELGAELEVARACPRQHAWMASRPPREHNCAG